MKILIAINSYGNQNDQYLSTILDNYFALPYQKEVVVHSNCEKESGIKVDLVKEFPTSHPHSFAFVHRSLFLKYAKDYDLFIYSEDDISIKHCHIEAFLEMTNYLPDNEVPGFLRYELGSNGSVAMPDVHGVCHWWPDSVKQVGPHIFAEFSNHHAAAYILTARQLQIAIDSGSFWLKPQRSRYGTLESAASDIFYNSHLKKVICISQLDRFLVHHMSNKYVGKMGITKKDVEEQVEALIKVAKGKLPRFRLFETETKLLSPDFDKFYGYRSNNQIVSAIDAGSHDVLSVGCGFGETELALIKKGCKVTGIPLDAIIAANASRRGVVTLSPNFEKAFASLSEGKFDYVILDDILPHLQDPISILNSLRAFLNKKGKLLATFPNANCQKYILSNQFEPFLQTANSSNDFNSLGIHLTNKKVVRYWIKQSNLKIERLIYYAPYCGKKYQWLSLGLANDKLGMWILIVASKS